MFLLVMLMNYDDWKSTEPVQYEEPIPLCHECGQSAEDGCDVLCSYYPQFFDRPEPEVEPCD
jgi:hypothetical protein